MWSMRTNIKQEEPLQMYGTGSMLKHFIENAGDKYDY